MTGFVCVSMLPVRIRLLLLTAITIGRRRILIQDTILLMGNGWLCLTRCRMPLVSSRAYRTRSESRPDYHGIFVTHTSAMRSMSRQLICLASGVTCSRSEIFRRAVRCVLIGFLAIGSWSSENISPINRSFAHMVLIVSSIVHSQALDFEKVAGTAPGRDNPRPHHPGCGQRAHLQGLIGPSATEDPFACVHVPQAPIKTAQFFAQNGVENR